MTGFFDKYRDYRSQTVGFLIEHSGYTNKALDAWFLGEEFPEPGTAFSHSYDFQKELLV